MAVRVAINGFGRIGRLAFRQMFGAEGYEIVALNDLTSPKLLAHLLKYDTAQGRYDGHTVESDDNSITVDGKKIEILAEKDPAQLPWAKIGVDVVLECTGFFTSKDKAMERDHSNQALFSFLHFAFSSKCDGEILSCSFRKSIVVLIFNPPYLNRQNYLYQKLH